MPTPLTLRQLAGAGDDVPRLADSVVLVIDAQKEYTSGALPLSGIDESVAALAVFLQRARAARSPIIHIIQLGKPGGKLFATDGPFAESIEEVKPITGEAVVGKCFPSSFTDTTLHAELEKLGRKDLIVTGYMTHMCVNSTTRDATEKGYRCTLVSELTATRDLPDGNGGVIPAATVKSVNLASLADRFAIVIASANGIKT